MLSNITHCNPLGRITGISSTSGSNTLQGWSYSWDALGNLTSRANTATGSDSESFQYDLLNRLTSAQVTNGSGAQPAVTYSYDAIGDITCKSDVVGHNCSSNPTGYAYGGGAGPHAVTSISGSNPETYSYDADGNTINRNGTAITWKSLNLLEFILYGASNKNSPSAAFFV